MNEDFFEIERGAFKELALQVTDIFEANSIKYIIEHQSHGNVIVTPVYGEDVYIFKVKDTHFKKALQVLGRKPDYAEDCVIRFWESDATFKEFAAELLFKEGKPSNEVVLLLVQAGLVETDALSIVERISKHSGKGGEHDNAKNNMIYGAMWCVGGIVATLADLGFIFWGAIVFGFLQFMKGAMDYKK